MSAGSLLTRLPRVAPPVATLRTTLLAALDGIVVEGTTMRASWSDSVSQGGWIVFNAEPGRILVRLSGPDPLAAARALGDSEPLIVAIEAALGIEMMPTIVVNQPAPDAVVVALEHGAARAWIAAAPTLVLTPPPTRRTRAALAMLDMPVTVRIAGGALKPVELHALAVGDLLLLPVDAAGSITAGARAAHGRLTAAPPRLNILSVGHPSPEIAMSLEPAPSINEAGSGFADLPVPIVVELANVTIPLATLSGLAPGSVLPLGLAGQSIPVRLCVGGRAVATGELVVVGEGYGVLIDNRQD